MAKKHLYYDQAEQLYVIEQLTLREVAERLPVSERTLGDWNREGAWDEKRRQHIESRRMFHEELYSLGRKLIKAVNDDLDAGREVSHRRLNSIARIVPLLVKAKEYEEIIKDHKDEAEPGDTDRVVDLVNQILGIR